ncbi:hypothetical protein H1R20_g7169, partial [Candolleomyces eurysporus]
MPFQSSNRHSNSQGTRSDLPPRYTPGIVDESGPSLPFNRTGPILNAQTGQTKSQFRLDIGRYLFVFILGGLIAWFAQDVWAMSVLNPSAIERRRLGWDRDYTKHLAQVSAMQDITAKWSREIEQHASILEAMRKERGEWDKARAQWQTDQREHERLQEEQMKLELERQRRELEKEKEDEEKKKAGLKWQEPQPEQHCLRFGTRRYTAQLENLPEGYNRMKACHETQAWINGRWVNPMECNDGGLWGGVHGTWIVDWDEGGCRSFFQDFKDKGCSAQGSGKRRIESQLQNLRYGDDGMRMCSSTPADFHGLHFQGPHSCVYWGKYGYWGLWFIEDGSCA